VFVVIVAVAAGLSFAPGAVALEGDSIAGTVTDASTHAGIVGIEVCASQITSEFTEGAEQCAQTTTGGAYTLSGLASGRYQVEFSVPPTSSLNYVTQYYVNASTPTGASPVSVSATAGASGIDAALRPGGRITGRVTDASTSGPIGGIEVCALPGRVEILGCALTNPNGEYSISRLASGQYTVVFSAASASSLNYITQYYSGRSSLLGVTQVTVKAEETTSGIDATLQAGGQISGTVTNASTNAAMRGVLVCALSILPEVTECAITNEIGHYLISGLPSANYQVRFSAGRGYLVQYYNAKYTRAEAQVVGLFAGELKSGIDAAMQTAPATLPVNTGAPAISGTPTVGNSLSCSPGSWSGKPPPTFTYQWLLDGAPIEGETESIYTAQKLDVAHTLSCQVTATNVVGTASAASVGVLATPAANERPLVTILSRKLAARGRSVYVKLKCWHTRCDGRIGLERQISRRKLHISTMLASGSFSLAPGEQRTVALHLLGKRTFVARRNAGRKHAVRARLSVTVKGGNTVSKAVLIK
jgi:hypothetical protein